MSVGSGSPKQTVIYFLWAMKLADFGAIFVTKCQFRMDKGKHNPLNGVSSHVPSCTAIKAVRLGVGNYLVAAQAAMPHMPLWG